MKVPISVLIPVKNEADNMPRCLASVAWADEIWVIDSQSTDATVAIAEAAGARVVQFRYDGGWPKKKNWALENLPFKHEWIFILDADEVLPPEAEVELDAIARDPGHAIDGYWINRRFRFMGQWLRHAYYPNWNLRFFRHRLGRFEQLVDGDTASGDNEVHEHVVVVGRSGRLRHEMDHYAFPSIEVFVEKHNRYSNWEARAVLARMQGGDRPQDRAAGFRRRLKALSTHVPFRPTFRFCYIYFWQWGFLDGRAGYLFARMHAFYEFLSAAKTEEILRRPQEGVDWPAPGGRLEKILGVDFYVGSVEAVVAAPLSGKLVLVPSGLALVQHLSASPAFRRALLQSDFNLLDSEFLLRVWRKRTGRKIARLSGLDCLRALFARPELKRAGSCFFVVADAEQIDRNRTWFAREGIPVEPGDHYLAPEYGEGEIADAKLVAEILARRPRIVVVALPAGVQERLGASLRDAFREAEYRPGIICAGAALATLTGAPASRSPWEEQLAAGWLANTISFPRQAAKSYRYARSLSNLVRVFGRFSPEIEAPELTAVIARRVWGIANLHMAIMVGMSNLLWVALVPLVNLARHNEYVSMLPRVAYPLALTLGLLASLRHLHAFGENLMYLDSAGAQRLAARQVFGVAVIVFAVVAIFKDPGISRVFLVSFLTALWVLLSFCNRCLPRWLARSVFHGSQRNRTLFVGRSPKIKNLKAWLERQRHYGTDAVGFVELSRDGDQSALPPVGVPAFETIDAALEATRAETIVVLSANQSVDELGALVERAQRAGCRVFRF